MLIYISKIKEYMNKYLYYIIYNAITIDMPEMSIYNISKWKYEKA
jgi:hypothetical protein